MADKSNTNTEPHHEGFFERILHHHYENQEKKDQREDTHEEDKHEHADTDKKESALDKMKDYLKEDEELEDEGRTYAGLM
ncbi:hypothetical protein N7462_009679 [Penicillium macrosclerotiorum]|uniref:uncharacterized protein n=1 Tax=Penicillium macrosclerotiorum TaxID=303699 RepID=UPI002546FF42|nr:uncharacterized protein N7462_009679 [Penicillium macrosclerotiorum]KAJ5674240.1 hypothetical protein N7462_009679 [Penicillium macrosclerotiorum]